MSLDRFSADFLCHQPPVIGAQLKQKGDCIEDALRFHFFSSISIDPAPFNAFSAFPT